MVQGMILAGVLAGSGLMATKMMNEQKMIQKGIESRDQIEQLHDIVYSVLQDNGGCTNTILANGLESQFHTGAAKVMPLSVIRSTSNENVVMKYDQAQSADENLRNRTYMSGNVQIKEMNLSYDPAGTTGTGDLEIIYERLQSGANAQTHSSTAADDGKRRMKAGFGGKTIRKVVKMRVQRNPITTAKAFTSCYAITSQNTDTMPGSSTEAGNKDVVKKLCEDMIRNAQGPGKIPAFRWDDATSSCLPNANCPDHMIYTGITTTGEVKCRLLSEWVDFNTMIDDTSGACNTNQQARLKIIGTNPVKVRIECY